MPETMSLERRVLFKALGAKLVLTPGPAQRPCALERLAWPCAKVWGGRGAGPLAMKGAIKKAEDIVAELGSKAKILQQFNNPDNMAVHVATTGPEVWEQTDGKIDVLLGGVGTGGTLSGTSKFLK